MKLNRFFSLTFAALALLLFLFFSSIITFITDFWWFQEVGFTQIFTTSLTTQLLVGFGAGIVAALILMGNLFLAARTRIPWMTATPPALLGQIIIIRDKMVLSVGLLLSLGISFIIGLVAAAHWQEVLLFLSGVSFGQKDPILGQDISFYIFNHPLYALAIGIIKALLLISLIGCLLVYLMQRKISLGSLLNQKAKPFEKLADKKAQMHLGILLALFLVTIAGSTYLSLFTLFTVQNGPVFGVAFTDATVGIPLTYIAVALYSIAAVMALIYGMTGKIAPLMGTITLTVIVGLVSAIVPPLFQRLVVAPNELAKETPFIKNNIAATRFAYNVQTIEKRQIVADKTITATDLANNNLTIKNVRLWDRDPLLSTFSQIQEIRTYYEFPAVDNDRYTINGETRQVMLSARELAASSLPNRNWINEHLTFTHGYGIAAGPVNQVTPEGLPVLFVKDLPPKSDVPELAVTRPEIYYGQLVNDYILTKTQAKEFDYPKGEENVYATYQGTGGVVLDSPLKRLVYAIHFSSLKMLLASDITSESRIHITRQITERVEKIAPFLTFDQDPYMVVADGKVYWIIDAYTTSNSYPYSQQVPFHQGSINYVRNSVKAVVDAYNGDVTLYQTDEKDPIIRTYAKIFPNAFKPFSAMPESLQSHIRYPEDIFTLQTAIYTTYHMDDPQIFYNKEDQWEVPEIAQTGAEAAPMTPRHMIMKLPNEEKEEYILMLPFTPRAKDNLAAWMVARNDGDDYGKLVVYSFPKDKLIYGPKQIMGRINQDAEISRQIALWDQRGSQVIQGSLLVIPIEESLVYVRPLYLKAETGKIPELKRVIVAYENKIAMEETLEEGLAKIFGTSSEAPNQTESLTPTPTPDSSDSETNTETNADQLEQAGAAYDAAMQAQQSGDWAKYGEEIKKLGDILEQLK